MKYFFTLVGLIGLVLTSTFSNAAQGKTSLVEAFISLTLNHNNDTQKFVEGLNNSKSLDQMITDTTIQSPYNCLPEFRVKCFELLNSLKPNGKETFVHEWGEWLDAIQGEQNLSDFVTEHVFAAKKLGFNLFKYDEVDTNDDGSYYEEYDETLTSFQGVTNRQMISVIETLEDYCRGTSTDLTWSWCGFRDIAFNYINTKRNICKGKSNQATFEHRWHKCSEDSNQSLERSTATIENIDGLYYPKNTSGWSCDVHDIGMDKGALGILSSKIYGLENTCDLSNRRRNGNEWAFTQECFGEGLFDKSEIRLSKTKSGILLKQEDYNFEWTSCPNKTLANDFQPKNTPLALNKAAPKKKSSINLNQTQNDTEKLTHVEISELGEMPNEKRTGRIYQANDKTNYELICNSNVLTMTEKSEFVDLPNPDTLYLSNSCSAFHPKHGLGSWGWANGGFGAELTHKDIKFPRAEIICEKEPNFVNSCNFEAKQVSPFVIDYCSFTLNGKKRIGEKCWVDIFEDGSFNVRTYGASSPFHVRIKTIGKRSAVGFHNAGNSQHNTHVAMGTLKKSGYCWSNQTSKVCTGHIAGKLLNEVSSEQSSRLKWKVEKPYNDKNGNKVCEVTSSQGLGIRFYEGGDFILAFIDVPQSKIEGLEEYGNGEHPRIPAALFFDYGFNYRTWLQSWDSKIDHIGRKQVILGMNNNDGHGHFYDGLVKSNNLYLALGELSSSSRSDIKRNATVTYSLKGSAKSIGRAIKQCRR